MPGLIPPSASTCHFGAHPRVPEYRNPMAYARLSNAEVPGTSGRATPPPGTPGRPGAALSHIGNEGASGAMLRSLDIAQGDVAANDLVVQARAGNTSRIDASHVFGQARIDASIHHRERATRQMLGAYDPAMVDEILRGDHDAMGREAVVSACVQLAVTDVDRFGLADAGLAPMEEVPNAQVQALQAALETYLDAVQAEGGGARRNWSDSDSNGMFTSARRMALKRLRQAADALSTCVDHASAGNVKNTTMGRLAQLMLPGLNDIACRKQGICLSEATRPGALQSFINEKAGASWSTVMQQWRSDTGGQFAFAAKLIHLLEEAGPARSKTPAAPDGPALPRADDRAREPMGTSAINNNHSMRQGDMRQGDVHNTVHAPDLSWVPALVQSVLDPVMRLNEELRQQLEGVGARGPKGEPGKSIFQLDKEDGFPGGLDNSLERMNGPADQDGIPSPPGADGEQGTRGPAGEQGPPGADGLAGQPRADADQDPSGPAAVIPPVASSNTPSPAPREQQNTSIGPVFRSYLHDVNPGLRRTNARASESLFTLNVRAERDNVQRRVVLTHREDGTPVIKPVPTTPGTRTVVDAVPAGQPRRDINHRGAGAEPRGAVNLSGNVITNKDTYLRDGR